MSYRQNKERLERHLDIILLVNRLTHAGALSWMPRRSDKPFAFQMPTYEAIITLGEDIRRLVIGGEELRLGIFYSNGVPDEIIMYNRTGALSRLYNSVRTFVGDLQQSELFMDRVLLVSPVDDLIRQQVEVGGNMRKSSEK